MRAAPHQADTGGAFDTENLKRQMERASANPSPPWRQGKQRKKTGKREKKPDPQPVVEPRTLSEEEIRDLWEHYGVPANESLRYKVNLCDDGTVITKEGEFIGTWAMDENEFPTFTPDGATEHLLYDVWVGRLCERILEWYETETGEVISD